MSCHFFLQGIFLTQGLNQSLLHKQADSLPLSHLGSPASLCLIADSLWKQKIRSNLNVHQLETYLLLHARTRMLRHCQKE